MYVMRLAALVLSITIAISVFSVSSPTIGVSATSVSNIIISAIRVKTFDNFGKKIRFRSCNCSELFADEHCSPRKGLAMQTVENSANQAWFQSEQKRPRRSEA